MVWAEDSALGSCGSESTSSSVGSFGDDRHPYPPWPASESIQTFVYGQSRLCYALRVAKHPLRWEGNSKAVLRGFSKSARYNLAYGLWRLENGQPPLDFRSLGAVLPGCYELRDEDEHFLYRVIYTQIESVIYVLHCFTKKTNQTSRKDIETARARLKEVKQRVTKRDKE